MATAEEKRDWNRGLKRPWPETVPMRRLSDSRRGGVNAPAVVIRLRGEVRSVLALGLTIGMRPRAEAGCQLPSHHDEGKVCD